MPLCPDLFLVYYSCAILECGVIKSPIIVFLSKSVCIYIILHYIFSCDVLLIIGDWNAKAGSQETPGVTGKFGLGIRNEAGQRLIDFYQENVLVLVPGVRVLTG